MDENLKLYPTDCPDFFQRLSEALNADTDPYRLALKMRGYPFAAQLITQIESRHKCAAKLSDFIANKHFFFPDAISAEQATNQHIAEFHSQLVGEGKNICDMTAGLGIDAMTMASANNVVAIEMAEHKVRALKHNSKIMGREHLTVVCDDSIDYLRRCGVRFDVIFCDPARRDTSGKRTHAFEDCTPDVSGNFKMIMEHTERLIIKSSPMLDISEIMRQIPCLKYVYVVCLRGECKEVTCVCAADAVSDNAEIIGIDIYPGKDSRVFKTDLSGINDNNAPIVSRLLPEMYLYEPNAAVMKMNCGKRLCDRYQGLCRLSANTNLYAGGVLYEDFPGRIMRICSLPDKKALKAMKGEKFNVCTRNYPLSALELRRKYGITDGGESFFYGSRIGMSQTPVIIVTEKVIVP